MPSRLQKIVLFLGASLLAGMLASCTGAPAEPRREAGSSSIEPGHWPRTLSDATGTTVHLQSKPARVVSTSVTATGSLLALGAEVVATSTAAPTVDATASGFLTQWADIASERDVRPLPEYGKFDLEDIAD
ncbi:hypothetical protein [Glutamicibacter ardleyensis]|uniref:hypothetical protein n=1 Tax=Glutamicibacter ardleyensis TaxID=225894 RepID=UPI003FD219D6